MNWTLSNNHARIVLTFNLEKPQHPELVDLTAIRSLIKENSNVLQQKEPEVSLNTVNTKTMELSIMLWISDFNKEAITAGEVKTAVYSFLENKGVVVN